MPRGGSRPGAGRPKRVESAPVADGVHIPDPIGPVDDARTYLLGVLNAGLEVFSAELKVRAAQILVMADAKQPKPGEKPVTADDGVQDDYAPRRVRTFGVVNGDRR